MVTDINNMMTDCLVHVKNIGSYTFTNICTGAKTTVPWGAGDWILSSTIGVLWLLLMLFLIAGVIKFCHGFVAGFRRGLRG